MKNAILSLVFVTLVALLGTGCRRAGPPYSPREALATLRIEEGFRIELFAAEPDVVSPVAMEFDEDGRIYVVEDRGYPLETTRNLGRVKLLEDRDGDGRPERTTIFADNLRMPTGVMRWKRGILVTDAPHIWYLEDADGDGRAEIRRVVLTGFAFTNPQHTVNGLVYGLDNWIYVAHENPTTAIIFKEQFGDRGSDIRFAGDARSESSDSPAVKERGRNIRFRPDSLQLEALSGTSQFGHAFDEWGHHFTQNNSNHIRHEVIAARYLKRNPDLPVLTAMEEISDHGAAARVFPITLQPRFQMLTNVGEFTSACGLTLYLGGAFPAGFERSALVAEPVHNLVHRDVLADQGSTFAARRARDGDGVDVEFLASTDSWFRPVNFYTGPDGAIYLLDFYRLIVEHPEWMSTHTHTSSELRLGEDRGRIYRITPATVGSGLPLPRGVRLGSASDQELVRHLANPNQWWRRTAQRLLVDRKARAAAPELVRLFETSPSSLGRLHALWTLEGLEALDIALVEKALADPEPGVRKNAVVLAERYLTSAPRLAAATHLVEKLVAMAGDADPKVRFQLLSTLGSVESVAARSVRDRLLFENIEDPWFQLAALSASSEEGPRLFDRAVQGRFGLTSAPSKGRAAFFRQVSSVIGARRKSSEVERVLAAVSRPERLPHVAARPARGESGGSGDSGGLSESGGLSDSGWWRAASLEGLTLGIRRAGASGDRRAGASGDRRAGGAGDWQAASRVLLGLAADPQPPVRRAAIRLLEVVGVGVGASEPGAAGTAFSAAAAAAARVAEDRAADPERRADAVALLALADPGSREALFKTMVDAQEPEQVQTAAVRALGRIKGEPIGAFLLEKWRTLSAPARGAAADAMFLDTARVPLLVAALQKGDVQPWTLAFRHKRQLIMNVNPAIRDAARPLVEMNEGQREAVIKRYETALNRGAEAGRGREVFERVCAKCHKLGGRGDTRSESSGLPAMGPDLGAVRHQAREILLREILNPSRAISQGYEAWVVETVSGAIVEGVLGGQTPATITLRQEEGREEVIQRKDIKQMYATSLSAMPADLDKQVNERQMADLLEYMKTAK